MDTAPTTTAEYAMGQVISRLEEIKQEKEQREGRNITWEEVAENAGIAYTTMLRWAKGQLDRYDKKALAKLCEYFEVQPGDILKYEE